MMEADDQQHITPPPPLPLFQRFTNRCCVLFSQLTVSEISGSVGDLGTFIPLVVALSRQGAVALGPTLFWAGVANTVTGCLWDVPMCVQPMKSIAAVAIAQNLTQTQVSAAGIWMGLFLVVLSLSNGIEAVNLLVPTPVVSGLQMGVGINLAIRGVKLVQALSWWDSSLDCIWVSVGVAALCLYWLREPSPATSSSSRNEAIHNEESPSPSRPQPQSTATKPPVPVGLYLFGLGMLLALLHLFQNQNEPEQESSSIHGPTGVIFQWALQGATWEDWKQGLLEGAIPQLPLTTLNSVVSVCCLAHTLYPEKRRQRSTTSTSQDAVVSRKEVSLSVGMMNLVLCPLGAMPCCHGAGGLAGQHKFGARHGASVVFLGINKMLLAVLLGGYLLQALEALPTSILGLMLVVCGHELALMGWTVLVTSTTAARREETMVPTGIPLGMKKGAVVALITVIVDVGLHKTHYAALCGWVSYMIYGDGVQDYWAQWSGQSQSEAEIEYSPIVATQELQTANNDPLQESEVI